jgi:hypothetical protein
MLASLFTPRVRLLSIGSPDWFFLVFALFLGNSELAGSLLLPVFQIWQPSSFAGGIEEEGYNVPEHSTLVTTFTH